MEKIFFLFYLILVFIIGCVFSESFKKYFVGETFTQQNETKRNSDTKNNCICDINLGSCDYLCCCDEDCPSEAIQNWREHLKCSDQKDTIGIFADRCIDQNLVIFSNNRRGLKIESQTEDIAKTNRIIYNYCYSMDNSGKMKNDIISLNDLKYYGFKEINEEVLKEVSLSISQKEFDNGNTQEQIITENNNGNYIKISNNNNMFEKSGYFSLYSGSSCQNSKNVEILKPENYSCFMNEDDFSDGETNLNNIQLQFQDKSINCQISNRYLVDGDNLLIHNKQESNYQCENYIKEVEFIIEMEKTQSQIKKCYINIVCSQNTDNTIFKNSIIFTTDITDENKKIPYRYSGNGGYINNFPLKIYASAAVGDEKVFNEFYIVGRNKDGDCRTEGNIYNYLYNFDEPIYFKQDYSYSCNLGGQDIKQTILYKKIDAIKKIARYGSSSYNNINDENDWLDVSSTKEIKENEKYILMNVYIGKKNIGLYSHNYIYNVTIKSKNINNDELLFEIKYHDLEQDENNEYKYGKKPRTPIILPNIPEDILDPLIYSEVDK